MKITLLHGKIHNARVTGRYLEYHGSLTIDETLLEAAGMRVGQQIQVYNSTNGNRFETYIIRGERDSGEIQVNGAAARLVEAGDQIIICTFAEMTPEEADGWKPRVVLCNDENRVTDLITYA